MMFCTNGLAYFTKVFIKLGLKCKKQDFEETKKFKAERLSLLIDNFLSFFLLREIIVGKVHLSISNESDK
jgi:hypothetical protein